jgi:hypothetical protein
MAITPDQARAELARRKALASGAPANITPDQAREELARRKATAPAPVAPQGPQIGTMAGFVEPFKNSAIGIGKSIGSTLLGAGTLGRSVQKGLGLNLGNQQNSIFDKGSEANKKAISAVTPVNSAQGTAKLVTDVGQYLMPAGGVNKATAALPWLTRAVVRTAPDLAISAAQSQGDKSITATTGASSLVSNLLTGGKATIAKNIIGGGLSGYVSDIGTGLTGARGEDRTSGKAFIPGVGTALGTGLGVAGSVPQIKAQGLPFTEKARINKTITKRGEQITVLEKAHKKVAESLRQAETKGVDVRKLLKETDLLNDAIDTNGTIDTTKSNFYSNEILPFENGVRKTIVDEGAKINAKALDDRMQNAINKSQLQGGALTQVEDKLASEFGGLIRRADAGGNIPLEFVHDAKVFIASNQNYTDSGANAVNKEVARILKEVVEENTKTLNVEAYNKGLSQRYAVTDVLEALNGKKVEGGRGAKYFAQTVGALAGAQFGPLQAVAGAEAGRFIKGQQLKNALGGNLPDSPNMPSSMQDILDARPKLTPQEKIPTLVLPKKNQPVADLNLGYSAQSSIPLSQSKNPSNMTGSLKTTQTANIKPTINDISKTVLPTAEKSSAKVGKTKGIFASAKDNLSNPAMRQGGYVNRPPKEFPQLKNGDVSKSALTPEQIASDLAPEDMTIVSKLANGTATKAERTKAINDFKLGKSTLPVNVESYFKEVSKELEKRWGGVSDILNPKAKPNRAGALDIKPRSPLPQKPKPVSVSSDNLTTEALKYKSAEEFANSIRTAKNGVTSIRTDLSVDMLDTQGPLWKFESGRKIKEPVLTVYDSKKDTYTIVDGHHRYSQALANKDQTIPSRLVFLDSNGNPEKLTKSQLTDIYNKAHGKPKGIIASAIDNLKSPTGRQGGHIGGVPKDFPKPKPVSVSSDNLTTEARKYKSEEEFVKGQPVSYHGTNQDFEVFGKNQGEVSATRMGSAKDGIFFTDSLDEAGAYGRNADKSLVANENAFNKKYEDMMEAYNNAEMKARRSGNKSDWDIAVKLQEDAEDFYYEGIRSTESNARVITSYLDVKNPLVHNADGQITSGKVQELIKQAKKEGKDGVILKNVSDNPEGTKDFKSNHTIVFSSDQIKTKSQLTDIYNKAHGK